MQNRRPQSARETTEGMVRNIDRELSVAPFGVSRPLSSLTGSAQLVDQQPLRTISST